MAKLLDLPAEIIIKILFYLDIVSTVSIRLSSKLLNDIFMDSVSLRYNNLLQVTGYVDKPNFVKQLEVEGQRTGPGSSSEENALKTKTEVFTVTEKFSLLQGHEAAWSSLDLHRKYPIDVVHHPSNIYDLTGGVYVLGDAQDDIITRSTRSLRYVNLDARVRIAEQAIIDGSPRRRRTALSKAVWKKIDIGVDIVDVGFALAEHDLVACLSRQWMESPWFVLSYCLLYSI